MILLVYSNKKRVVLDEKIDDLCNTIDEVKSVIDWVGKITRSPVEIKKINDSKKI